MQSRPHPPAARTRQMAATPTPRIENASFPPPRRFNARRRKRGIALVAIIAVIAAIASCILFTHLQARAFDEASGKADAPSQAQGAAGESTPKSEWRQGQVPLLFQTDPAWSDIPYANSDIGIAGCGPTCLSMVYIALTGKTDMAPPDMAAFSMRGGFVEAGLTSWSLMTQGASQLGLAAEELPADEGALATALAQGCPVIASMRPGDFTTEGHFIVIAGLDSQGDLIVRDPNSAQRSAQAWDAQTVLSQCANLWVYSQA